MTTDETNAAPKGPLFVVGPSRSGTSMVRESFNRHPRAWIVRETHYFDDLRPRLRGHGPGPLDPHEVSAVERYFLSLGHRAYGAETDEEQSVVPRELLRERAAAIGGSGDAYFEAFCRIRAEQNGKEFWGEKTPRHAFRIAEMLAAFPGAHVVGLVRDPRAVVASYRDWTRRPALDPGAGGPFSADRRRARASYNVVLASVLCKAALRAAVQAREHFGPDRVRLLVYEELVAAPERELGELTAWLGLHFDPAMLDVPMVQSSYAAQGAGGISTEPLQRWRSKLSPAEVRVIESSCDGLMRQLGYSVDRPSCSSVTLCAAWLSAVPGVARAALANRRRLGRAGRYIGARVRLALGT